MNPQNKNPFDLSSYMFTGQYTFAAVLINVLCALAAGLWIYTVYKKTHSGVLFSKNLGVALVIVCIVTSLIVMAISGNLALSLGMIGALSIIRFRTPVKDPKDLAYLFWAVATGVICGISAYNMAFISAFFVGVCMWVLSQSFSWQDPYLLVVHATDPHHASIQEALRRQTRRFKERSSTYSKGRGEVVFEVTLKNTTPQQLLKDLQAVPGVDKTVMVSYEGDLDEPR